MSTENISNLLNEENNVPIYINQIKYYVSSDFSAFGNLYIESLVDSKDSKKAIADVVYEKLKSSGYDNISIEDIQKEKDDNFLDFINSIINENSNLNDIYIKEEESSSILQRFSASYSKYWKQNIASKLNLAPIQAVQQIAETMRAFADSYTHIEQQIAETMRAIANSLAFITDAISKLEAPEISDTQMKKIIESHEKWAKYGWSVLPYADINFFNTCPEKILDADRQALKYINKNISHIFSELKSTKIKKKDLEEAILCFENKCYKACSLVLFSIIDSKLIKSQPKDKAKKVGLGAVKIFINRNNNKNNTVSL